MLRVLASSFGFFFLFLTCQLQCSSLKTLILFVESQNFEGFHRFHNHSTLRFSPKKISFFCISSHLPLSFLAFIGFVTYVCMPMFFTCKTLRNFPQNLMWHVLILSPKSYIYVNYRSQQWNKKCSLEGFRTYESYL
jgi:hypothetical protein